MPSGLGHSRNGYFLLDIAQAGFLELILLNLHHNPPE
jgi:hypothetical protein